MKKLLITLTLFSFLASLINPLSVNAIGFVGAFGGRVLSTHVCTCLYFPGIAVTVGPPKRGTYLFLGRPPLFSYSKLYELYRIYGAGQWVLGTYTRGGVCLDQDGYYCTPAKGVKLDGTIAPQPLGGVGTSVY